MLIRKRTRGKCWLWSSIPFIIRCNLRIFPELFVSQKTARVFCSQSFLTKMKCFPSHSVSSCEEFIIPTGREDYIILIYRSYLGLQAQVTDVNSGNSLVACRCKFCTNLTLWYCICFLFSHKAV